jgi:hypothetical protein
LRRDFRQLCAYCERPEAALGGAELFEIDHFRPTAIFPGQATYYPNLYYTCGKCNRHKSKTWPSEGLLAEGFRFSDPCEEDTCIDHLEEMTDGTLRAPTKCGEYTRNHIRLDRLALLIWRQTKRQVAEQLPILQDLAKRLESMAGIESDPSVRNDIRRQLVALDDAIARQRQLYSL